MPNMQSLIRLLSLEIRKLEKELELLPDSPARTSTRSTLDLVKITLQQFKAYRAQQEVLHAIMDKMHQENIALYVDIKELTTYVQANKKRSQIYPPKIRGILVKLNRGDYNSSYNSDPEPK